MCHSACHGQPAARQISLSLAAVQRPAHVSHRDIAVAIWLVIFVCSIAGHSSDTETHEQRSGIPGATSLHAAAARLDTCMQVPVHTLATRSQSSTPCAPPNDVVVCYMSGMLQPFIVKLVMICSSGIAQASGSDRPGTRLTAICIVLLLQHKLLVLCGSTHDIGRPAGDH